MLSLWYKLKGTLENTFSIGAAGPKFAANGTNLEAQLASGSTLTNFRVAVPVGTTDAATKDYVDNAGPFRASYFTEISAATTTTVTTYADLLSLTVNTTGAVISLHFTTSLLLSINNLQVKFKFLIDGVDIGRGAVLFAHSANDRQGCTFVYRKTGLVTGSHSIKVQWALSAAGTATVDPTASPSLAHASLLVYNTNA